MQPNDIQWARFYQDMLRKTGLDLSQYKAAQLQRRIIGMVNQQKKTGLEDFFKWLSLDGSNMAWFLDKMAINVSELFRNPEKWAEMESKILPELAGRARSLKCWSAGCSYGAEAHTLACILQAKFPGSHTILGTDIDLTALAQAERSEFSQDDMKCVPAAYRKCFVQEGSKYKAVSTLKPYLKFKRQNLLADQFETGFDLIMCRNVVIYFTDEAKDRLYERFYRSLKPGGIMFVGSTERVFRAGELGFESAHPFFYRRPLGDNKWRSAS